MESAGAVGENSALVLVRQALVQLLWASPKAVKSRRSAAQVPLVQQLVEWAKPPSVELRRGISHLPLMELAEEETAEVDSQ